MRLRIRTLMILVALTALSLALIAPAIRPRPKQPQLVFCLYGLDGKRVLATPEEEVRMKAQYFAYKAKASREALYLAEKANHGRSAP
jgi:hypothetical protein